MTKLNAYHLALFGPMKLIVSSDEDVPRAQDIEGVTCQALLAALVAEGRKRNRAELFKRVWSDPSIKIGALHTATNLLKGRLGTAWEIIDASPSHLAISNNPSVLITDWHLLREYGESGDLDRCAEALTIARKGPPLEGVGSDNKRVGMFVERMRQNALKSVLTACATLGLSTDFQWGKEIPTDWPLVPLADWPDTAATDEPERPIRERIMAHPIDDGVWQPSAIFEPCQEGEARRQQELDNISDSETRWPGEQRWLGEYYSFWSRTLTVHPERIAIIYQDERYDAEKFGEPVSRNGDNDKGVIVGGRLMSEDPKKHLICAYTNWNFAHVWAKDHADDLLAVEDSPSVFGKLDQPAYPGIAGVHTVAWTRDDYVLFGLRGSQVDFHERTWSASFEESISVIGRDYTGPVTGDANVFDAIEGGLVEEWGIEPSAVAGATLLSVGREFVRTPTGRLDLSSSVLAAVRLDLTLADVWKRLARAGEIRDRDEHACWAGVKFQNRDQILGFLVNARGCHENTNLLDALAQGVGAKIDYFPDTISVGVTDRGLMPTSAARLYLGSAWMAKYDHLAAHRD